MRRFARPVRTAAAASILGAAVSVSFACDYSKLGEVQVSDQEIADRYRAYAAGIEGKKEYRVLYIRTDTEEAARALIRRLDAGEDFEKLALAHSAHLAKEPRVDLGGYHGEDRWGAQTLGLLRSLKVGEHGPNPVKGTLGFGIYKLAGVRPARVPSAEEARATVRALVVHEKLCQRSGPGPH